MNPIMRNRKIELDFLRGIAILAVMGYHFRRAETHNLFIQITQYPFTHFGHEGVNLFFALSGFLVGGLLLRQYAETGNIQAGRFIIRRIFKIWPAYYVLIAAHLLVGRHDRSTFLVQNLLHLQNYLGSSIAQSWSLAVEEHFYLVLPILLLGFVRFKARANTMLVWLGFVCAVVLVARSVAVAHGDLDAAFFQTQYRLDSLLAGVMLAVVYWLKPKAYRTLAGRKEWLVGAVALLPIWLAFSTRFKAIDESIGYTIQAIGYVALIVLMLEHAKAFVRTRLCRVVAWMGVYSYGLYLWHTVALAPGDRFLAWAQSHAWPELLTWIAAMALQAAIAIPVGYGMTRLVEFPFLRLRNALVSRDKPSPPMLHETV